MAAGKHRYVIAFGSNRRHGTIGPPRNVLGAASVALHKAGIDTVRASRMIQTAPLGPSLRKYANAALLVETTLEPEELLDLFKQTERDFGRQARGQRWSSRVLDLDIVLWSGGPYASERLTIPHPRFRERSFVLCPAVDVAPDWRDPLTGYTLRQLKGRLTAPRALSR
jgi:2-amino-4-hydroxy-6-hydroxymethyldihydropteridine diphosphokinase